MAWKSINWKAYFFITPTCMAVVGIVHTHVYVLLEKIGEVLDDFYSAWISFCVN